MAQANVYSLNVVGYYQVTLPADQFTLVANQLDTGNNYISNVIPNISDGRGSVPLERRRMGNPRHF